MLKKPVIFYDFAKRDEVMSLKRRGVGFEIKHPEDLTPVIKNLLYYAKMGKSPLKEENFYSFTKDYAYEIDGQSSQRVKNIIRELMRK